MRTIVLPLAAALYLSACTTTAREGARSVSPPPSNVSSGVTFIEDDYSRALTEARKTGRLLFVDTWAPWCHTCVSMKAFVFPDPTLRPVADGFVWLSLDTEKKSSEGFLAKFPIDVWPTLFVLDPQTEVPIRRWVGSVTAAELVTRLQVLRDGGAADKALAEGSAAASKGQKQKAIAAFRTAWVSAPPGTPQHLQAVESLLFLLDQEKQAAACVDLAQSELPRTPPGTTLATVASAALTCALELPTSDAARAQLLKVTDSKVSALAADLKAPILADDRSSLYETLVDARKAQQDAAGARAAAKDWAAFLEHEAAAAPTPAARAVFDPHRLLAYLELGEPQRAVPMLEASEAALPQDYNPEVRLAQAYLGMSQPQKALSAVQRARSKVYGPRTLRVLLVQADVYAALKDSEQVKQTLAEAEALVDGLPEVQRGPGMRLAISAKRQKLLPSVSVK